MPQFFDPNHPEALRQRVVALEGLVKNLVGRIEALEAQVASRRPEIASTLDYRHPPGADRLYTLEDLR